MPADEDLGCHICGMPVTREEHGYLHVEVADAVFCSILRGTPVIITDDENRTEEKSDDA